MEEHLPDPVKTCVYRVVQEALHNCEKHSGASIVRVTVRQLDECLLAKVEDDGRGFFTSTISVPPAWACSVCASAPPTQEAP